MEKLVRNLVTNSLQQSTESYRLVFGKILFPGEHFKSVLHFKIKFEVMTCFLNLTRPRLPFELFERLPEAPIIVSGADVALNLMSYMPTDNFTSQVNFYSILI